MSSHDDNPLARRRFLQTALSCAALGVVTPTPAWLVSVADGRGRVLPTRPDDALEELRAGNERYASNRLTSTQQDLAALRRETVAEQHPFAAVLACADSRVDVELLFDQPIGRLFVSRVAGNIAAPEVIASLEYAVAELGVQAVFVLGHTNCGAVKAALKSEHVPGQISSLYAYLRPGVKRGAGGVQKAVEANAQAQADLLRTSSTVIGEACGKRSLVVACGVYDLASGKVVPA
jgi:carbonic anhydrase